MKLRVLRFSAALAATAALAFGCGEPGLGPDASATMGAGRGAAATAGPQELREAGVALLAEAGDEVQRGLAAALIAGGGRLSASALDEALFGLTGGAELAARLVALDAELALAKGVGEDERDLLELRLADESMLAALAKGEPPCFATAPAGPESGWTVVRAKGPGGKDVTLDARRLPDRPVVVVGIDEAAAAAAGERAMRAVFAAARAPSAAGPKNDTPIIIPDAALDVSVLDSIRLSDDMEPWISGAAEVYAVVVGIDPAADEPSLEIVDMPYLDYSGTTYTPGQGLIYWNSYRYQAADIAIFEHDDNTNYTQLATAFVNAAAAALAAFGRPDIAALGPILNAVIEALPDSWMTNEDDYVDSYYLLQRGVTYVGRYGAAHNALVTVRPNIIPEN